jgi:murein hydrolase activator
MRRARPSRLLAVLPFLAAPALAQSTGAPPPTGDPSVTAPAAGDFVSPDQETAARHRVDEAERVRAMEIDAQKQASARAAQALAKENQLTTASAAVEARLKKASAVVDEMKRHLADLERRQDEARRRIARRENVLTPLVPLILRLSRQPIETLLASGLSAEDAVRGIIILRGLTNQAEVDVRSLASDQKALEAATREAQEIMPRLAAAKAARSRDAEALAGQLASARARRKSAREEADDAARHAAAEAARANTLRSMLAILVMQRRLAEAQAREDGLRAQRQQQMADQEAARLREAALSQPVGADALAADAKPAGQLVPPVSGTLVRGWGDPQDGEPATGLSWQTPAGADVVAPCTGTVAFAEPFRGYGLLVIIDCGGGYHAVISGMDRLSVTPGGAIKAGAQVGTMRAATPAAPAPAVPMAHMASMPADAPAAPSGTAGSARSSGMSTVTPPVLYFELRKGGRPVNPAPWLRSAG